MNLSEIVGLLSDKHITAAQSLKLFGQAAGPAMFALIQQGRPALDALTESLHQSDGAAKAMADAMMSGLPGAFEQLKGSVDSALIALSTALQPVLLQVLGALTSLANFVTNKVVPAFTSLPSLACRRRSSWWPAWWRPLGRRSSRSARWSRPSAPRSRCSRPSGRDRRVCHRPDRVDRGWRSPASCSRGRTGTPSPASRSVSTRA
jgi:hypothetical protein